MTYPHTIDNGHGEKLTFLGIQDGRLRARSHVAPGAGPPMHIHHMQTESMSVHAGRVGVQIAGEPQFFRGPGETVTFAPGVEHRFWNAGEDELVMTGEVYPPHNLEFFLTQVFASTKAHGGRPGAFDGAFLMTRYRDEFTLTAIPVLVRRFVLPIQAFLGRLLRRYGHFEDAPAPVRRPSSATLPGRTTSARSSAG